MAARTCDVTSLVGAEAALLRGAARRIVLARKALNLSHGVPVFVVDTSCSGTCGTCVAGSARW